MQVTLKRKINGNWIESVVDISALKDYEGTDAVALIAEGFVWCGNKHWLETYSAKGFDATLQAGIDAIMKARAIFKENREERIAIMTTEGVPEKEAVEYCDTLPNIYGKHDDF